MSTGLKLKLKIGGNTVTPRPAGPPDASGAPAPAAQQRAPSVTSPAPAPEHKQHKEKKKKMKRHREEDGRPAHASGGHGPSISHAAGPSSSAQPGAPPQPQAPIKLTIKGFPRPTADGAAPAAPPLGASATQPRPEKKRKKEREGGGSGGGAASQHAPLLKLRLKSSSGGWDQQLAAAAAAAAVAAAEQGRPGPTSLRISHGGGAGLGGPEPTKGVQKPKKKKQKPPGGVPLEVRKPPPRIRRASARSESRDEEADGYEAATPDPLQRPGHGFAPPPKGAAAARPATSAARAASSQDQAVSGQAEPEAASAPPPGPEIPPKPTDIERVMDKVQKRDVFQIFKEPVTDAVAPGYSAAIKRPMDFTTMRKRHAEGAYTEWDALQADMRSMFTNAMTFNPPETLYHKQAKTLLGVAEKLVALGRRGIKDTRGRTASIVRAANASLAADAKAEGDKARAAGKAEKAAVQQKKLAQTAAASGVRLGSGGVAAKRAVGRPAAPVQPPVEVDETVRNCYPKQPTQTDIGVVDMKGLACGANAEGTPFGRLALAPLPGANSGNSYAKHFRNFIRNLSGKAKAFSDTYLRQGSEPRPVLPPQQPQQQAAMLQQSQQPVPQQQFRPAGVPAQPPQQVQQQYQQQQQRPADMPTASGQPAGSQLLPPALAPPGMPAASAAAAPPGAGPASGSLAAMAQGGSAGMQPAHAGAAGIAQPAVSLPSTTPRTG